MDSFENEYGQFNDNGYNDELGVLDQFLTSKLYDDICTSADRGDEDSIAVMQEIADRLGSLIFHITNNTGASRISYEITEINRYVDSWGDFE
jgi:hypothetical protein